MENWPILGAFLTIQTAITAPMAGVMWRQIAKLEAEKNARLADKDAVIASKDREIAELKDRNEQLTEMAFDAVRGMNTATGTAQTSVQIVREERARRGVR